MAKTVKLTDLIPSRYSHLTPGSEENIERIRVDLVDGSKMLLNDPHVFREGEKWEILAGHDRVGAAKRAGWTEIQVRDFSGAVNTDDQILAHFCRENLLRKDISKAAIAGEWLRKHPDWSDGKIAAESGCTSEHVGGVRAELVASGDIQLVSSRVGRDGRVTESKRSPRKPRQPKKGPLGKPQPRPTPAKPKAEKLKHESAADMAAALTRPKPPPSERAPEASAASEEVGKPASTVHDDRDRIEPVAAAASTPASEGGGAALAIRDVLGELPAHDDPNTTAGLTYEDRTWFLRLSSWAIRIASKCPKKVAA